MNAITRLPLRRTLISNWAKKVSIHNAEIETNNLQNEKHFLKSRNCLHENNDWVTRFKDEPHSKLNHLNFYYREILYKIILFNVLHMLVIQIRLWSSSSKFEPHYSTVIFHLAHFWITKSFISYDKRWILTENIFLGCSLYPLYSKPLCTPVEFHHSNCNINIL